MYESIVFNFYRVEGKQVKSLPDIIEAVSETHTNLAAIELTPLAYIQCPQSMDDFVEHRHQILMNEQVSTSTSSGAMGETRVDDEESGSLPPRFGVLVQEKELPSEMKNFLFRTSMVVSFSENRILYVESETAAMKKVTNTGQSEGRTLMEHKELGISLSSASLSSSMDWSRFDKEMLIRVNKRQARKGEYSVAEVDASAVRVLHFRSVGDSYCAKALFGFQSNKQVCESLKLAAKRGGVVRGSPFMTHNVIESLARRYSIAIDNSIPK